MLGSSFFSDAFPGNVFLALNCTGNLLPTAFSWAPFYEIPHFVGSALDLVMNTFSEVQSSEH